MAIDQNLQMFLTLMVKLIAAGGGGAVVAYGLFQWLGKSWLDQHFAKQLEQLKHDQQKEIEQVRYQIDSQFSRISKIHEKEFEILPEAWTLLRQAHGAVFQVTSVIRRDPDLDRMTDPQLHEFLASCPLPGFQKAELCDLKPPNRNQHYRDAIFWVELSDARQAHIKLNNCLVLNSIFMTQDLRQKFKAINDALTKALIEVEIARNSPSPELRTSVSETLASVGKMFDDIESAVQKRLHYEDA
jgi:hypothetical protein